MTSKRIIIAIAIVLTFLHHDTWNWGNSDLVFGFMPVGLFYHACYSLAAAILWVFAIKFAWPKGLVDWAEGGDSNES